MSLKLHQSAYDYAQKVIQNRRCVLDQPSDWTDHRPARNAEDKFIAVHGLAEFGRWHLGEVRRQQASLQVSVRRLQECSSLRSVGPPSHALGDTNIPISS
jgi:hypothetical protein